MNRQMEQGSVAFSCNLCNHVNRLAPEAFDRESPTCAQCRSNVRVRSLLRALSMELFGANLPLSVFPRLKSLRGLGLSDKPAYAAQLADTFDYRNTSYAGGAHLDITDPPAGEFGRYDFVIASEIFEHVRPPLDAAFRNAFNMLGTNGLLLLTVPYSIDAASLEHYPDLKDFGLAQVGGGTVVVGRDAAGKLQAFDNPVFHLGKDGPALEMREISESELKDSLTRAGFNEIRIYSDDYAPFGVIHRESWSLPVVARKGAFALRPESTREIVEQWAALDELCRVWAANRWVQMGSRAGVIDLSVLLERRRRT
jgi:hypothetical protein